MRDQELVNALREHAEWAEGNQWETPITLGDDLAEAADQIEAQSKEIEKLRGQLRHLRRDCDLDRLEELAEADKDGRLVVLPCKTRQEKLLEQYPTADVDENGILEVCPALLFASHRGKKGGCSTLNRSCDDCRKEFWGLWDEAALEAMKDGNG